MYGKRGREGAGRLNSSTSSQILGHFFFQMARKDTKLDSNGVQIAIVYFRKSIKIARQLLALSPDHVCHAHELKTPLLSTAPK